MKKGCLMIALLLAAMPWAAMADQPPAYVEVVGDHEFSGEMIVRPLQSGSQANGAQAAAFINQNYMVNDYVWQTDEYVIRVPAGMNENQVAAQIMATGLFQYAEPNWIVYPIGCPNDSLFGNQWHHDTSHLESCAGWDTHTGNNTTTVAICDTGIRTTHQDFALNRKEGYNAVDQKWEGQGGNINPVHPHGTQTTGCAAANGNDGKGVTGVGWNLGHRMIRVSNSSGGSSSLNVLQHGARTAIEKGDRVASVSYSGCDNASNLTTATYIKSINGILVWAAGNDNRNLTFGDRDADDIIIAGATTQANVKAGFSAYGPFVDLVAPGESVYTTDAGSDTDYASVSGTSFACPLTAGLLGLIFSANPSQTPDQAEEALKKGTRDLGAAGVDNIYGYGLINVKGSMALINPGDPCDKIANHKSKCKNGSIKGKVIFVDSSQNGKTITLTIDGSFSFNVTVSGAKAKYKNCCFGAGSHTVAITNPACPAFNRTVGC